MDPHQPFAFDRATVGPGVTPAGPYPSSGVDPRAVAPGRAVPDATAPWTVPGPDVGGNPYKLAPGAVSPLPAPVSVDLVAQFKALEALVLARLPDVPARTPGVVATPTVHSLSSLLGGALVALGILLSAYFGHPDKPLTTQQVQSAVEAAVGVMKAAEAPPSPVILKTEPAPR